MRADKVRDLDSTELQRQLAEMTEQIYRLRFQLRMGQNLGLKKYRGLRKDLARVLTELRGRELAAGAGKV